MQIYKFNRDNLGKTRKNKNDRNYKYDRNKKKAQKASKQ